MHIPYTVRKVRSGSKNSPVKQGPCMHPKPCYYSAEGKLGQKKNLNLCSDHRQLWEDSISDQPTVQPVGQSGHLSYVRLKPSPLRAPEAPGATPECHQKVPSALKLVHTHWKGHFVPRPLRGLQLTVLWTLNKIKLTLCLPKCPVVSRG